MSDHPVLQPDEPDGLSLSSPTPPGTVTGGPSLGPLPSSYALLADRPDSAAGLLAWGAVCEYDDDDGLRSSPLAGAKGTRKVAFWRVHGGFCTKTVSWVMRSIEGKAELPTTNTGSDNEVILRTIISPNIPTPSSDGSQIWTVTGKYIYQLQTAPENGDQLGTGRHPLSILPAILNTLNPLDFVDLLGSAVVTDFIGGSPIDF